MSDINLKLVIAMARTYDDMFFRIEKNIRGFGLNISEFGVLEMLYHKGDQPVQKVAEKILVTSGTITYVINKLERRDLVIRRRCNKDKRIFYIGLTETGKEYISHIFPKHKSFLEDLFKDLDKETKTQILNSLTKLSDTLK